MEELLTLVKQLIKDIQHVSQQKQLLYAARARRENTLKRLTTAWFEADRETVPDSLVLVFNGETYHIQFDTEGDHCHKINIVDMVVGSDDSDA
jgi:predicted ArsR family transcriptional regulator